MKKRINLLTVMMLIGFVPLVISLLISTSVSIAKITSELKADTNTLLSTYTDSLSNYFGPDWNSSSAIQLIDEDYEFIDSGKKNQIELTLFKANSDGSVTRYISSIIAADGKRASGPADPQITDSVYNHGETVFQEGVIIAGKSFTVCYKPFYDENDKLVGMVFAGRPDINIKAAINSLMTQLIVVALIIIAVFTVIIIIIARFVSKPLRIVSDATIKLADANISDKIEIKSNLKETSEIIDSAVRLRDNLNHIVNDIKSSSVSLKDIVKETKNLCGDVANGADVIDTVVQELSNTACSLDSTISTINEQIIDMGSHIDSVVESINTLNDSSKLMNEISENSSKDLADVYEASMQSVASANNISEHMSRLNEAIIRVTAATDMISGIANKTRLLSLNASIEAARAGESGKGFAVVADEIGTLAANSATSVNQINEIVEDIVTLSSESAEVIGQIGGIIAAEQEKVNQTRQSFELLKSHVNDSVNSISSIFKDTESLNTAKQTVISAISDLGAIAEENAASCQECSASVSNIATTINHVNDKTADIEKAANLLEDNIHVFN